MRPNIRNALLFLGGLAGVGHETLLAHSDRPTLLILFAAMMGLPAFLTPSTPAIKPMEEPKQSEQSTADKSQPQPKVKYIDEYR